MNLQLLFALALLACPIGMGLMMWLMNRNMGSDHSHSTPTDQTAAQRLAALRAQRQALEAEIAETARIAELEAKRDALREAHKPSPEEEARPARQSAN